MVGEDCNIWRVFLTAFRIPLCQKNSTPRGGDISFGIMCIRQHPIQDAAECTWILPRPKNMPPACFFNGLSNPTLPKKVPPQGVELFWRREWDSNPRWVAPSLVFKTSSLNRSDISPLRTTIPSKNKIVKVTTKGICFSAEKPPFKSLFVHHY